MKKHLIAAAALATLSTAAFAQSATVYGIFDLSYSSTSKADGTSSVRGLTDAVWMPSVFGITGSEDLGGGMKASFNLESDINVDTGALSAASGSKLFGRKSNVALSGNFGELKLGKDIDQIFLQGFIDNIRNSHSASGFMVHALSDFLVADDAGYNTVANPFKYVNEHSVFTQNMVRYTTPSFNGLKLSYQHSFGEVAGQTSTNKSDSVLVNYSIGAATLSAGQKKVSNLVAGVDHKLNYLGATYTMGQFKVAATYHKSSWESAGNPDFEVETKELGASYAVTPKLTAALNYVTTEFGDSPSAKITSGSLKYSLSKRTALWTLVSNNTSDALSDPAGNKSPALGANYANALQGKGSSYSLGITHTF